MPGRVPACRAARALRMRAVSGALGAGVKGGGRPRHPQARVRRTCYPACACRVRARRASHTRNELSCLQGRLRCAQTSSSFPCPCGLALAPTFQLGSMLFKKMGSRLGLASYLPGHVPHKCLHGRHHRLPCRRLNLQKHSCMSDGLSDGSPIGVGCLLCESSDCPR